MPPHRCPVLVLLLSARFDGRLERAARDRGWPVCRPEGLKPAVRLLHTRPANVVAAVSDGCPAAVETACSLARIARQNHRGKRLVAVLSGADRTGERRLRQAGAAAVIEGPPAAEQLAQLAAVMPAGPEPSSSPLRPHAERRRVAARPLGRATSAPAVGPKVGGGDG